MNIFKKLQEKAKYMTILCVEDEKDLRESIVLFLKKFFKSVDSAEDGLQGLEKYMSNSYDIVLTDIQMPKMDGLELLKEIKRMHPDRQGIILSAFDHNEYLLKAIEVKVDHYIIKPIDVNLMAATLLSSIETLELRAELEQQREIIINQSRTSAMSDMLLYISHHWRQPLNAVAVSIQSLSFAYELGELNKEYLDKRIAKSMEIIQNLSSSLDQFRSFFVASPQKSFNPFTAIDELVTLLIDVFESDGIDIKYSIKNKINAIDKIEVKGDVNEFKQVVLSILNNSKDAINSVKKSEKKYRGEIDFTFIDSGDSIDIVIKDNGGGADPEILNRVFDPFFTTHNIADKKGLGLYIANMIICKKMGGELKLENEGKGLKVEINLSKIES
ncbi:MAG: response regulator [Sulfurimonas sp.]